MAPQESLSPWRRSEIRVDVSLTPRQYGKGSVHARRAAQKQALKSFFMTYNTQLGGVPVAQHGAFRFPDEEIRFIDESPYAHVTAEFTVLLFAPQPGSILTGEVIHVGADHVGLTVLGAFHALIPKDKFFSNYKYTYANGGTRTWKYTGENVSGKRNVEKGKWLKFSVVKVRPAARGGLFNIVGTVQCADDVDGNDMETDNNNLGFIEPEKEIDLLNGGFDDANNDDIDIDVEDPANLLAADEGAHFNDDLGHLLDDADKAPLHESPTKIITTSALPKSTKKKRSHHSEEKRKRKRKRNTNNNTDVDINEAEVDIFNDDKSHLRTGDDDTPLGGQRPDGEDVDVAQVKSMKKSKRRKIDF